jgi:hypothetical protein
MRSQVFQLSGRLKTNIGNIYFKQKQYLKAIKMYRMALDQIPVTNQDLKYVSWFDFVSVVLCAQLLNVLLRLGCKYTATLR